MTIREQTETLERLSLSRYATLSEKSRGRKRPEDPRPMRTCYQRDRDRIIHCKGFPPAEAQDPGVSLAGWATTTAPA